MKSLFFAILLSGISALAAGPEFQIVSGQVQHNHGGPYANGKISIDYTKKEVTLSIDPNYCPADQACTMEFRPMILRTLPIKSITLGACNIQTVVAKEDKRPVDGILQQLTVEDFSKNSCPTFAEIIGKAEYLTSGYDFRDGKETEEISKFNTKMIYAKSAAIVLLEKTMVVGFAPPAYAGRFSLQIMTDGKVQRINNHDEVTVVAQLAGKDLAKIQQLMATMGSVKLVKPNGPGCLDAPSQSIVAHQADADTKLWTNDSCQESKTDNKNANALISIIEKLDFQYPTR